MRHGPKVWTEKIVSERLKSGLGSGSRETYRPWQSVHDLSSRGRQTRTPISMFGRVVHTHSYIERAFLLWATNQKSVLDIQDQWPIPRELTLAIAEKLGIRHPTYSNSHAPVVMTFDFVVTTVDTHGVLKKTPWDCKRDAELNKSRTLEKLTLHRGAAAQLGMETVRLFSETSVPKMMLRNIGWLHGNLPLPGEPEWIHELYVSETHSMLEDLARCSERIRIVDYCLQYDVRRGFTRGTALRVYSWLLSDHRISVDLEGPHIPHQLLPTPASGGLA